MGLYLASINTAGRLGLVDTAQFKGGRIRQNNKLTPGRADVFLSDGSLTSEYCFSAGLGQVGTRFTRIPLRQLYNCR